MRNASVFAKLLIFHFGKVEDIIKRPDDNDVYWIYVGDNFSVVGDRFFT